MKKWFKRLFTATRSCPQCGQLLRFPINKGNLRISCPACQSSFMLQIQRVPNMAWNRNHSWRENLKNFVDQFRQLRRQSSRQFWTLAVSLTVLSYFVFDFLIGLLV